MFDVDIKYLKIVNHFYFFFFFIKLLFFFSKIWNVKFSNCKLSFLAMDVSILLHIFLHPTCINIRCTGCSYSKYYYSAEQMNRSSLIVSRDCQLTDCQLFISLHVSKIQCLLIYCIGLSPIFGTYTMLIVCFVLLSTTILGLDICIPWYLKNKELFW